jgi:prepilin-type N-terminal cleavage/methylation domain-containing protein
MTSLPPSPDSRAGAGGALVVGRAFRARPGQSAVCCRSPKAARGAPGPTSSLSRRNFRSGFTLVEILVAASLSLVVLAGVLTASLQIMRSGVRITQYAEMETQVRRALDTLSRDLKEAVDLVWNGESDITLTIPTSDNSTAQVTYAWTAASESFFRVAGANSATITGRLELVRGIRRLPNGSAGLTFARFDRDGASATTDAQTKRILVTMTVTRSALTASTTSENLVSATFTLRNKPSL